MYMAWINVEKQTCYCYHTELPICGLWIPQEVNNSQILERNLFYYSNFELYWYVEHAICHDWIVCCRALVIFLQQRYVSVSHDLGSYNSHNYLLFNRTYNNYNYINYMYTSIVKKNHSDLLYLSRYFELSIHMFEGWLRGNISIDTWENPRDKRKCFYSSKSCSS